MSRVARLAILTASVGLGACTLALPGAPSTTRVHELVAGHRQKALALERSGELRRSLDEWKIALTVDPRDAEAREGQARVAARLDAALTRRLRLGQEALQRGAPLEARRHFLTVLALDPANKTAFAALRDVKDVASVTHTVARGETLSSIAQRYYGDRTRAEVIWETNRLPANPRLAAGTRLKIPEIPGLPMRVAETRAPSPAPSTPEPVRHEPREAAPEGPPEELGTTETNPLLADTQDALERKEYPIALASVDRLLEGNPRHTEWVDLRKSILYAYGAESLAAGLYDDSFRALTQLTKLDPQYKDTTALLQQARTRAIQAHHAEGIRLYREEQLEAAIAHWRAVLEYDPGHADAKRNIEQAERILRALQDRLRKP